MKNEKIFTVKSTDTEKNNGRIQGVEMTTKDTDDDLKRLFAGPQHTSVVNRKKTTPQKKQGAPLPGVTAFPQLQEARYIH